MPWVKIDDRFTEHPKVAALAPAWRPLGVFLHINALCWCNSHLTDGRIPKSMLERLGSEVRELEIHGRGPLHAEAVAAELVACGLWEDHDDAYVIHDFHDFQPTRREVEARRRHVRHVRSQAGSKGASKRVANRQANVQQHGKQTCSPVPVPQKDQDQDPGLPAGLPPAGQGADPDPGARVVRLRTRPPDPANARVLTMLVASLMAQQHFEDEADLKEVAKATCARLGLAYDADLVRRAMDGAKGMHARQNGQRGSGGFTRVGA